MSDADYDDNSDGPPTPAQEREWEEMELNRVRQKKLAFQFDGTPTNRRHHEWLQKKRRQKHLRQENSSSMNSREPRVSEEQVAYNIEQSGGGSTGRLIDSVNLEEEVLRSMELVAISPKQEFPTQMNINLHSPKRDEWFGILAIIDSGTEENWIAEKIVQDYNLRDEAGMPICCTDFGGGHIESDRCVKLTWRKERAKKTERAYFHVGKDAPFDVLFGSNIMNAAPALFRDNSTEPALVLVQNRISSVERTTIEQNRAEHKARSRAASERMMEKKQSASRNTQSDLLHKGEKMTEKRS